MKLRPLALFIATLSCTTVQAASLNPVFHNGELIVIATEIPYPSTLQKDLKSALTNRLFVRVTVEAEGRTQATRVAEYSARYDLWDEKYQVTVTQNGETEKRSYSEITDVISMLSKLRITNVMSVKDLNRFKEFALKADILLNPIEKERMDKIRAWVTQNSIGPTLTAGARSINTVSATSSNTLFNKIFEQYSNGATTASIWKDSSQSRNFRPLEVVVEKH